MVRSALLSKFRSKLEFLVNIVATHISKTHLTPNTLTFLSLLISLLGIPLVLLTQRGLVLVAVIVVSGFLDALDGALARISGKSTLRGALLDSFVDRICEAIYALALLLLRVDVYTVLFFLILSFLVSYLRARGEALGVTLSGIGLMERAERLIGIILVSVIVDVADLLVANTALTLIAFLTGVTVIQRFLYTWRQLNSVK